MSFDKRVIISAGDIDLANEGINVLLSRKSGDGEVVIKR